MRSLARSLCWIVAACAVTSTAHAAVLVFAASSTTNAMDEINALYAASGVGSALASYGSSGVMARQIENGAPADIFLSADERWIDYLGKKGFVRSGAAVEVARNRLALVAPTGSRMRVRMTYGLPLAEKLRDRRLVMGDPGHVPAGRYARAALESLGVWDQVAERTARTNNVREALALVERGEAGAGIVYATDAAISGKVRTIALFPEATHPRIVYYAVAVAGHSTSAVRRYFAFLASEAAAEVLRKHRFLVD
jgi:molybdate transport system substrate-binding protein